MKIHYEPIKSKLKIVVNSYDQDFPDTEEETKVKELITQAYPYSGGESVEGSIVKCWYNEGENLAYIAITDKVGCVKYFQNYS